MVRCEDFYKQFKKRGNFCGKSEVVAKKVEDYIEYVDRNKIGTYKISNSALEPFMNIEFVKEGFVHRRALRELKDRIKKKRFLPEKITRRISIEIINKANMSVGDAYKLEGIPGIRSRMGEHEHEIGNVGYNTRTVFDIFKKDIGVMSNDDAMSILLETSLKDIEKAKKIKDEKINGGVIEIVKET